MTGPDLRLRGRRRVYSGWNSVDEITVEVASADGETIVHDRVVVDHGHAVAVLPVDPGRRTALLVRQWRAPLVGTDDDPFLLEACAGIIDPGEMPEAAVRREAEEEMGIHLGDLEEMGRVIMSPGALTETIRLYLATYGEGSRIADGGGLDHEGEVIEIVELPLDELYGLVRSGALLDAKTVILIQMLMLREGAQATD
ncbi:MAG TPA: NUDIX hydrolase [Afifellaceae bacterium]|nr:NUDIX hydrolase [Afifellaceae bacterium]